MTNIRPVRIPDIRGGLWSGEPTLAKKNQVTKAVNMFYNKEGILQTRRGQRVYGEAIPEANLILDACDVTTGFTAAGDAGVPSVGSARVGVGSVQFDIDPAGSASDYASISKATLSADITDYKGSLKFSFYHDNVFNSMFLDPITYNSTVVFRLGTDSSNYYEWDLTISDLSGWELFKLNYSDATEVGTIDDTAITYVEIRFDYDATLPTLSTVRIDNIVSYSDLNSNPVVSLKYFKSTATPAVRYLLAQVGDSIYRYDDVADSWYVIKNGLTDGARFSVTAYKNIMYLTNGEDNYMSYDGAAVTEHTGTSVYKGKFVILANDRGYIAGDPSTPTTLGYTNGLPTNLITFPNALVLDEDDSSGKITGITNLGPIVIVTKERKIYEVNIATPSSQQLDYSDGAASHRSVVRVENSVFIQNERGIYSLAQRQATEGSLRADPLTDSIQSIMDEFDNLETAAAIYANSLQNFYLFGDTNNNGVNNACIVRSSQRESENSYTTYNNINANEAVIYEDSDGVKHLLIADSTSGQVREIEYGTNDNGNPIKFELHTAEHDFGQPETMKTFEHIEIFGFMTGTSSIKVKAYIDDQYETAPATVNGEDYIVASGGKVYYLGGSALATTELGGSTTNLSGETIFYPFVVRIPIYQAGFRIKISIYSEELDTQYMISKYSIYPYGEAVDFFPNAFIA